MTDQQVGDFVVIIIVVGALTIGLISMAIGWIVDMWDRLTAWRLSRRPHVMSRMMTKSTPDRPIAPPVDQQSTGGIQPIATTNNAINNGLSNTAVLPDEAREIIRFQAKVEVLADLIKAGQVTNMAKGIEVMFHCSRSGKDDSVYQRARRALDPLVKSGPQFRPLSSEQQAAREALGLPDRQNA